MGRRGRPPYPDILTPREWEVLALLREGLTNEAIAARLGVTHAAAKFHVSQILSKLGVATREEAAAWEPEAARRPWWAAGLAWLRPVTVGKATLITAAVAVLEGMGLLAWGVLRDSEETPAPAAAVTTTPTQDPLTPAPTESPQPTPAPPQLAAIGDLLNATAPSEEPVFRQRYYPGIYELRLGGGLERVVDQPWRPSTASGPSIFKCGTSPTTGDCSHMPPAIP